MTRSARELRIAAEEALIKNKIARVYNQRDWDLLEAIAALAEKDAPRSLARTDPSRYRQLREAVTRFHIGGWTNMTVERVRKVRAEVERPGL